MSDNGIINKTENKSALYEQRYGDDDNYFCSDEEDSWYWTVRHSLIPNIVTAMRCIVWIMANQDLPDGKHIDLAKMYMELDELRKKILKE